MIFIYFFFFSSVSSQNDCLQNDNWTNNFNIGVRLPWLKVEQNNLLQIPKYLLVETSFRKKKLDKETFVCRVDIGNNIKIIGKLHYTTQECEIPPRNISQVYQMNSFCSQSLPVEKYKNNYEVLTNPKKYQLLWPMVDTRGIGSYVREYYYMPSQPVIAQNPNQFNNYQMTFIARFEDNERDCPGIMGIVLEFDNLSKIVFYYGMNRVEGHYRVHVLAVLNRRV